MKPILAPLLLSLMAAAGSSVSPATPKLNLLSCPLARLRTALIAWLTLTTGGLHAVVQLGLPFSDHLVLQAHRPVPVWGTASPGETVAVEFAGQTLATTAGADGAWRVTLAPLDYAPGHATQTLVVRGTNELRVADVLVGEVWLCSGQSNMRFTLGRQAEPRDAAAPLLFPASLAGAMHPRLRLLNVSGGTPAGQRWAACSPETAKNFSAVGYFFGTALQRARDVPVGLIDLGRGGASIRTFLPAAAIDARPEFKAAFTPEKRPGYANDGVFAGEVVPLAPFALRGVLWYQGESDVGRAALYPEMLGAMIGAWRGAFAQPELPFLIVQLPAWERRRTDPPKSEPGVSWAGLREAQSIVARTVPHTRLMVAIDLGERLDIHPRRKAEVGERLATLARAAVYGEAITHSGPVLRKAESCDGGRLLLTFTGTEGGLLVQGRQLDNFAVAGADGVFIPATAEVTGHDQITVTAPTGDVAKSIRYGWQDYFVPTFFNGIGWPAAPFRMDTQPAANDRQQPVGLKK